MSDCIIFPPGGFQKLFRESYFRTQLYLSESFHTWDFIGDFLKPIFRIMVNGLSFLTETVLFPPLKFLIYPISSHAIKHIFSS